MAGLFFIFIINNHVMDNTFIYIVENCFGDPNKIYIGKTTNTRKSAHKRKFGNNIEYTIIDQIQSINKKDWKCLETMWICCFKSWGFNVLNKNEGGGGPPKGRKIRSKDNDWKLNISKSLKGMKHTEETKRKMSEVKLGKQSSFLGKKHSNETKEKISQNSKGISRGKGKQISNITKQKMSESHKGLKTHTKPHSYNTKQKISKSKSKPVLQYTKDNIFVKEWNSAKEAEISLNITLGDVSRICRGEGKTCKGYKWKLK